MNKRQIKTVIMLFALFTFILISSDSFAQGKGNNKPVKHGSGFVDNNGDGFNDNAPDQDGDGIPNGQDPDYQGGKFRNGNGNTKGFIDQNGDGINDRAIDSDGDGIPNCKDPDYVRPQDGTGRKIGFGRGHGLLGGNGQGTGTGICDGTGPKGKGGKK